MFPTLASSSRKKNTAKSPGSPPVVENARSRNEGPPKTGHVITISPQQHEKVATADIVMSRGLKLAPDAGWMRKNTNKNKNEGEKEPEVRHSTMLLRNRSYTPRGANSIHSTGRRKTELLLLYLKSVIRDGRWWSENDKHF